MTKHTETAKRAAFSAYYTPKTSTLHSSCLVDRYRGMDAKSVKVIQKCQ